MHANQVYTFGDRTTAPALRAAILLAAAVLSVLVALGQYPIAFALMFAVVMLVWPVEVGLGLFVFIVPFEAVLLLGENSSVNWAAGMAAGGVLMFHCLFTGRFRRPGRAALWWGALATWSVVTTAWAINSQLAMQRVPTVISLFLLYLVVSSYKMTEKEFNSVVLMAVVGGVAAAALAVWQFRGGGGVLRATLAAEGQAANPNVFASTLLFPFALSIGQSLSQKRSRVSRLLMLGAAGVMAFGIFLSMSRGALLAMAAACLVFLRRFRVNWRILVPVALMFGLVFLLPDLFFQRVGSSVASRAEHRFDVWRVGFEALKRYFVFGAGLSNFPVAYTQFAGYAPVFQGLNRSPHNVFLGVWVEMGILGISTLLAAIVAQVRDLKRLVKRCEKRFFAEAVAFEAGYVAVLVHALVLALMWRKSFWVAAMMASAFVALRRDISDEQPATKLTSRHF